jgi:ubiquinone/menaquinone biosynthesis C-methylase UbiE
MASQHKGHVDATYLDTVQGVLSDLKRLTYEHMRLEPGDKVLDAGCGPGTDTIPLAPLVGPSGRVIGVDHDAEMIAEAERRALEAGVTARVTHEQADATALPYPAAYFDACRCERLFEHLHDPAKALSEMARVTRSGGWIVVLDSDWGSLSIDTCEIDAERRQVRFFTEHVVNNGYSGRQLYRLFKRQGLADVSVQVCGVPFTDYALVRQVMLMERCEREAVVSGVVSAQDLERLHACWEQADADGVFFASMSMVLVSGRKP